MIKTYKIFLTLQIKYFFTDPYPLNNHSPNKPTAYRKSIKFNKHVPSYQICLLKINRAEGQ